jgi:hypothetical protein
VRTADGGYLFGGNAFQGLSGNKTTAGFGALDWWVVKIDSNGNQQWQRTFGGSQDETLYSMLQTSDGGFVFVGSSHSGMSGNKTSENFGSSDAWIVKTDADGTIQWQRTYGGSAFDVFRSVQQTPDGGYIVAGDSRSEPDGQKLSPHYGQTDFWILKLDANGNRVWERSYGGSDEDIASCIHQTTDLGFIVGGPSASGIDGTKTAPNHGDRDYWVLKIDASGNEEWQASFGGSESDYLYCLEPTSDGGYVLGGAGSATDGNKTAPNYGSSDYWVVKLDSQGQEQWQASYGGTLAEHLYSLRQIADGGYLLAGGSYSDPSGNKMSAHYGSYDFWLVKIDSDGNKRWEQALGGAGFDRLFSAQEDGLGGYILCGDSNSGISGTKTTENFGDLDFWIVKLSPEFDSTPPVLMCPTDLLLECTGPAGAVGGYSASAMDTCDPAVTVTCTPSSGSMFPLGASTVNCEAQDDSGNRSTCSFTVTVSDTTSPVLACPADRGVECGTAWTFDPPTAVDLCDGSNMMIQPVSTVTNGLCGVTFSVTRIWAALDQSGNQATCSQTITVVDTTAPVVVSCPPDMTIECPAQPAFGTPAFSDTCDANLDVTFADETLPATCPAIQIVKRTWTARDDCGHTVTCSQTITVEDRTAPVVVSCPPDMTIECPATPAFGTPAFSDTCDANLEVTFVDETLPATCPAILIVKRTWTARDACGHTVSCSQTITVEDRTVPVVVSCPPDMTIECPATPVFGTPAFSDTCDANLEVTFVDETLPATCPAILIVKRTWTARDDCGHTVSCSQTITVEDRTVPVVVSCPPDMTIECPATPVFGTPAFSDTCDANLEVTFVDETLPATCPAILIVKRTWTARDDCGHTVSCSQTITVEDRTAPVVVSCPPDATIECPATPVFGTPAFSDTCDANLDVTFADETLPATCPAIQIVKRTWTARDDCGHTVTCSQTITVRDTTPPTITCPANGTVQCVADIPPPDLSTVTASDNCGTPTKSHVGDAYHTNGCVITVTRTYKATDACGNMATCVQSITVHDTTPPTIVCPQARQILCTNAVGAAVCFTIAATDNCDTNVTVTCTPPSGSVFAQGTTEVSCEAEDECGNRDSCTFRVTVLNQEPRLSITRQGANVLICWPATCAAYRLQETLSLNPTILWRSIADGVGCDGETNCVTVPIAGTARFYRLCAGCD